ncbi:MAG TPA: high-potential iron-sulfur protein [Steroidobacteraceae bacterium]|nr:high-potential iron-sulfur protein [Steroidobacteraceae bacterium]
MTVSKSRRELLRLTAIAAAAAPLAALLPHTTVAAGVQMVDPKNDPTAKALGYVEDASKATAAKPGSTCGNCQLYTGAAGSADGPCGLFQGKHVKAAGWCSAWTKRV